VAHRIYEIVGREFDVGKPSILSKVIFDDMRVADPRERTKPRSVSTASLSAILETEDDPITRELLQLVLDWLSAKATEKRGGFIALGAKVADMPEWTSRVIPDHDDLPVDASALPVVLIDGHYIIFRSFYAMPTLTAPDGTPVGALVGFCNFLNKLVLQPWADGSYPHRRIVVAFDTGMDTFRHKLYPGYKADRAEAPEDLRPQFALIKRACEAYGLDVFESQGYEADDVIASLAFQAVTAGATNVTIVSADKDLSQLVTRRVNMFNYYTGEMLGPEEVLTKFLAPPGRLADLLAIAGDKADGIRGAEGYGPVTAAKVLARHANLEDALDEICSTMLKKKKDPALISDTREQVLLARRIVELCSTVPLKSRQGCKSLHTQAPYGLTPGDGASYLLDFMRNAGMPDLVRRTAQILGVNEDGSRIL
ncbi:unnamed protein product, partial [Ascophyllum nodosum]